MWGRGLATGLMIAITTLAACGGSDTEPEPDSTASVEPSFDPSALDLGRIDPTPTDVKALLTPEMAYRAASWQLGEHLVLPSELDPDLRMANVDSGAGDGDNLAMILEGDVSALAGSTASIFSRRSNAEYTVWVGTGIIAFADESAAAAAAEGMAAASLTPPPDSVLLDPYAAVTLPGHPDAFAMASSVEEIFQSLKVFRAEGPFVSYAWISYPQMRDEAQGLAEEFLDDQAERLSDVQAVQPKPRPARRDVDPTGLLTMTLATDGSGGAGARAYTAGPHAATINQIDAKSLLDAFELSALTDVAANGAVIYRTEDSDGPAVLMAMFHDQAASAGMQDADPPPGLDDAVCMDNAGDESLTGLWPASICWYRFGEYLAETGGQTLTQTQQLLSAQVVLLHQFDGQKKRKSH